MCGFWDGRKPVEAHGDRNERPSVKPFAQSFSDDGWCRPVKVVRCPSCDTVVPPFTRWRYCPGCGTRFDWEGGEMFDREALLAIAGEVEYARLYCVSDEVAIGRDVLTSWVRRIREACGEEA